MFIELRTKFPKRSHSTHQTDLFFFFYNPASGITRGSFERRAIPFKGRRSSESVSHAPAAAAAAAAVHGWNPFEITPARTPSPPPMLPPTPPPAGYPGAPQVFSSAAALRRDASPPSASASGPSTLHPTPRSPSVDPTVYQSNMKFDRDPTAFPYIWALILGKMLADPHDLTLSKPIEQGDQYYLELTLTPTTAAAITQQTNLLFPTGRLMIRGTKAYLALGYQPNELSILNQYHLLTKVAGYLGKTTSLAALTFEPSKAITADYHTNLLDFDKILLSFDPSIRYNVLCFDWDYTLTLQHVGRYKKDVYDLMLENATGGGAPNLHMDLERYLGWKLATFVKSGLAETFTQILSDPKNIIAIVTYHWDLELIEYVLTTLLNIHNTPEFAKRIFIRVLPFKTSPRGMLGGDGRYQRKNRQILDILGYLQTLNILHVENCLLMDDDEDNITEFDRNIIEHIRAEEEKVRLPHVEKITSIKAVSPNNPAPSDPGTNFISHAELQVKLSQARPTGLARPA